MSEESTTPGLVELGRRLVGFASDRNLKTALREASAASWRDGVIVRVTTYSDIDEARAAAEGLAEERG